MGVQGNKTNYEGKVTLKQKNETGGVKMSGGSYNYTYYQVEDEYVGRMYDKELDEMMKDLCKLLHDLEWWQSGDTCEEDYFKTVAEFKGKYFKRDGRIKNLEQIIEAETKRLKDELIQMLGE